MTVVVAHMCAPGVLRQHFRAAHIDVVIAGNERHVLGGAEAVEPMAPARELLGQRDIGEIAGDRDVVRRLLLQIGDDLVQHGAIMDEAPPAPPIDVAGGPLADKLAPARLRQRRQMRVGEMGEGERHMQRKACHARLVPAISLGRVQSQPKRGHTESRASPVTTQMRYELPINIPARNTSTPPTTTWNAACRNGVSM